jgi:Spy/CpxP family protein refolding chaperone
MTTHRSFSRAFLALAAAFLTFASADRLRAQTHSPAKPAPTAPAAVDPATHAAHVAAGAHPARPAPDAAKGDPALNQQLSQLQEKVAQLEAALAKAAPPMAAALAGAPPMAAAPAGAAPTDAAMKMMDKMMGMMDKMMSMGSGGSIPAGAPAAGMNGDTGMGTDKMEMAGLMGTMSGGAADTMPQSALPGFPGASRLYHIGATGFFLDHPQHISLTTEQQAGLNKANEQAALAKSTADRAVEQAEQELWTLTAADQPDATQAEAKIREIAKLRGDERLAFIHAVGQASKLLTDEQRKSLTGFAPPASAAPTAAPMAGGMKDM